MRLLREIVLILLAACVGTIAVIAASLAIIFASGDGAGDADWQFALTMLIIMIFWPLAGITAVTRSISLLFRRGESWRHSIVVALALTTSLLVLHELVSTLNRNWGSVAYVGMTLFGAGVSAVSVTLINNAIARRARR